VEQTEGAKFWLRIVNELRDRGVNDILIAAGDGLQGFPRGDQRGIPHSGSNLHHSSDANSRSFVSSAAFLNAEMTRYLKVVSTSPMSRVWLKIDLSPSGRLIGTLNLPQ
jgi:hypothetical protein